mmetsp:Transcript_11845/g.25016  ORF Transcript_11845/g.25016 Transcript_11845/m.25016 type:complete len:225 (-) Transcript_11845:1597-2271(-)
MVPNLLDRAPILFVLFQDGRKRGRRDNSETLWICGCEHLCPTAVLAAIQCPHAHARWVDVSIRMGGLAAAFRGAQVFADGLRDGVPERERRYQPDDGNALPAGIPGTSPGSHDDASLLLDGGFVHPQGYEPECQHGFNLLLSGAGQRIGIRTRENFVETADAPIAQQNRTISADDTILLHHGNGTNGNFDGTQISLYAVAWIQKGNESPSFVEGATPGCRRWYR